MTGSEFIYINDVGPRDGLQSQSKILTVDERKSLIYALAEANLSGIEVGAFVSPKAVPAMASTQDLFADLPPGDRQYSALIPNMKGYEIGRQAGVPLMSLVVAASNTMNEKNIRMTTADCLEVSSSVLSQAAQDGCKVQAYVATAWACPFEGEIKADAVINLSAELLKQGAKAIVVADTIGAANPANVYSLMKRMVSEFGSDSLSCHFHDTRAMGLANTYAAIEAGVRSFDASIAGLGGCPFAPGASGNVATEDVVMMCEQMGYETGVDMHKLLIASDLAIELTGTATGGKAKIWLENNLK